MPSEPVIVPGLRDVRGSLDGSPGATTCVVACPPHPQYGGSRRDQRLRTVSETLVTNGFACLRFDYGPWDNGQGERGDAVRTVRWADDRFDRVVLFGYSFGGGIALLAAVRTPVAAVSALAPASRLGPDLDVVNAVESLSVPVQIQYGNRDDRAAWQPVVERARDHGAQLIEYRADHFFLTKEGEIANAVTDFLKTHLG